MSIKAKKSLGQNWLVNPHIIDKIIEAAQLTQTDTILEVGPGTGNLTKKIAEKAKKVIAVEKDRNLIEPLRELFKPRPNVEIVEADVLNFKVEEKNYKVIGNIPYYITSNLIRTIFEDWPTPILIILTIQKEVAQRIIAKPPHMNLLALSVQYYSEPKIITYISKNNFRPVPKVDSAIIKLTPKTKAADRRYESELFKLIKAGFSEKRKQLANNLEKGLKLDKDSILDAFKESGIEQKARAENLSLAQWQELKKYLNI